VVSLWSLTLVSCPPPLMTEPPPRTPPHPEGESKVRTTLPSLLPLCCFGVFSTLLGFFHSLVCSRRIPERSVGTYSLAALSVGACRAYFKLVCSHGRCCCAPHSCVCCCSRRRVLPTQKIPKQWLPYSARLRHPRVKLWWRSTTPHWQRPASPLDQTHSNLPLTSSWKKISADENVPRSEVARDMHPPSMRALLSCVYIGELFPLTVWLCDLLTSALVTYLLLSLSFFRYTGRR
jgi:hypothetical protein